MACFLAVIHIASIKNMAHPISPKKNILWITHIINSAL